MSLLDSLPHSATAKSRTRTKDSLGGSRDSYSTTVFADRACWLQLARDGEKLEFQKRSIEVTNRVYFSADPELGINHILEIGSDSYKVKSTASPDASAGLGVLWRVMVELVSSDVPL